MIFDFYNQYGALNSLAIFKAFEAGIVKHGHDVVYGTKTGDVAVIWSMLWYGRMDGNRQIWNHYRSLNKPVIVLEVGALQREITWKIGINGINLGSYFYNSGNDNQRRSKLRINLKPWRQQGSDIIVCCQHGKSEQWKDQPSVNGWVESIVNEIKQVTDRNIKVRPHPRFPFKFEGQYLKTKTNFLDDLTTAWAVVNWNSNPGIQSIINGVPAFVGPTSLAYPVANKNLSTINTPELFDREQWINDLAWTEWTVDEMTRGKPQELLLRYFQLSNIIGS